MALSVRVSPVGVGNNDDAALRIENRAASLPASPLSQVVVAADDEEEEEPDEEESIEAPRPWWVHMLPQWVVDFLDRIENSSAMGLSRIDPYVVIKLKPWKDIRAQTKPMVRARSNFLYNRVHDNIIELDVPNTFPNTARRTAHIRLELWDKDAMVDDLMGYAAPPLSVSLQILRPRTVEERGGA
jgi:hypothetical protein